MPLGAACGRDDRLHGIPNRSTVCAILILVTIGAALRFAWIDASGLWQNELFSVFWAKNPFTFLWSDGMRMETNPPLYFSVLKIWMACFGQSAFAVRALSALASLFCIPIVFGLGRAVGGSRAGLAAAAVTAISAPQIYFSAEARGYALIPPLVALALLLLWRFGERPARAARVTYLAGYVACAVAMTYLHVSCVFLLAAIAGAFALYGIDRGIFRAALPELVVAHLAVALLAAPELIVALGQGDSANIAWFPPVHPFTLSVMVRFPLFGPVPQLEYGTLGGRIPGALWWQAGMALLLFALAHIAARRGAADRAAVGLFTLIPVLYLILLTGVSFVRPLMLQRIMIGATVPGAVLAGLALTSTRIRLVRLGLAGGIAAASVLGIVQSVAEPADRKPDWPAMLPYVAPLVAAGDLVVVGPHASVLGLAQTSETSCRQQNVRSWQTVVEPGPAATWLEAEMCGARPIRTAEIAARIADHERVWLLLDTGDEQVVFAPERDSGHLPAPRLQQSVPGLKLLGW